MITLGLNHTESTTWEQHTAAHRGDQPQGFHHQYSTCCEDRTHLHLHVKETVPPGSSACSWGDVRVTLPPGPGHNRPPSLDRSNVTVPALGIEPSSWVLQTLVLTTITKLALYLVLTAMNAGTSNLPWVLLIEDYEPDAQFIMKMLRPIDGVLYHVKRVSSMEGAEN